MAYESGALSSVGRARVERHLRTCTICQRELAVIQTYEATVDRIRDEKAPELDWSRMELALEREARAQAKKHQRGWAMPAIGVLLAAAAAIALVIAPGTTSTPVATAVAHHWVVDSGPPSSVAIAPAPYEGSRVTLVAGPGASADGVPMAIGASLDGSETLATAEASSMHARLEPGLAVALAPSTSLRLATLDGGPELTLAQGRVAVQVRGARTIILAGAYRVEVEVASFVLDLDGDVLRLDVQSGGVRVTGPATDETLTGPARFPHDAAVLEASTPVGASESYDTQPMVHVARPGIVRWQLGDVSAAGAGEITMRVGAGPTTITGWDARGRAFRASVIVTADGLDLTPDELQAEAPRIRSGTLAAEEIRPVFHQHQGELQRCFEHQLRVTPTLQANVEVRVALDMAGSVDSVSFGGDPIPPEMAQCMSDRIGAWIFPPPHGGPFAFSVPVPFTTH
jgi:ferric-dicitrate binding protein FerR (iron transport regulator)